MSADTKIAELLTELHQLIKQTQEERSRSEHNLLNIQKTHERMQTENKTSPYYRTKLRGLYTTAKADAEAECSILRHALDKIAEIKSLLEERRLAAKMAGVYSDTDPPRKTMRRGVLMTLLQQSAMTLPLWIGKPGDSPPPLCGATPASSDYVAKQGDKVAARVKAVDGDEQWILAEVVSYSHATNKRHTLSRRRIIPLPQWKANPETDPEALFSKDQLPQDDYSVLFEDTSYADGYSPPLNMSDSDSDSLTRVSPVNRPPKRRRIIIDPSTIKSVPIYSNKVNNCLQWKPTHAELLHNTTREDKCDHAEVLDSSPEPKVSNFPFTDSEEEGLHKSPDQTKTREDVGLCSPSPPSTPSYPQVQVSTRVWRTMKQVNSRLDSVTSLLANSPTKMRTRRSGPPPTATSPSLPDALHCDDDIYLLEPEVPLVDREIKLKFRCRTGIHRVSVVSSSPLSEAVKVLSVKLNVPPSRILLLRNEMELPAHSSANQLSLSIADIIDCVVVAEDAKQEIQSSDIITVRLQGKDKGSTQEYSLNKEAPLGTILSQYTTSQSAGGRAKLRFLFDGSKINASHTPAQLDMEDGDVIEVWS
ncbi:hypothetical protein NHX12_032653 [Muraenolepis orangiensis]|uniref:NFATC2-interacting protein n=1 Tax=Muraenolepis orangiensis TaxID=630683 RepID=A0A9Q0E7L5_9TELE|nr:hypothetical protein NHX12_032653 [Muraenolepis orangiensis]